MEVSFASASASSKGSLRRRAPRICYCLSPQKPMLVVSWTNNNSGKRFYGCPNYWIGKKCKFFQWVDDKICECGKVLIPEMSHLLESLYWFPPVLIAKELVQLTTNFQSYALSHPSSSVGLDFVYPQDLYHDQP
nr:hypothetical protein CFP56_52944 [Quercus suber]